MQLSFTNFFNSLEFGIQISKTRQLKMVAVMCLSMLWSYRHHTTIISNARCGSKGLILPLAQFAQFMSILVIQRLAKNRR